MRQLLPENFEMLIRTAVRVFWQSRGVGGPGQEGARGSVIGGKNLDGFLGAIEVLTAHCGLPRRAVHVQGRSKLTLPGYFRPTKNWDVVVVHEGQLLAALEFKSQVGSLGNNFNNRTEEALGMGLDMRTAVREGGFVGHAGGDPRPPFLGYLMLLEDSAASAEVRKSTSPHFPIRDEFDNTSYAQRYRLLCEKMMAEQVYTGAALMLSPPNTGGVTGEWRSLSPATDALRFFNQLAGFLIGRLA